MTDPSRLRCWRVEFDADGALVSCALAEPAESDGGLVHFVYARDSKRAQKKAARRLHAARAKARRAQYAREGKCRCGRLLEGGKAKRCPVCVEAKRTENQRRRRRLHGEDVPRPDRHQTISAHREADRNDARVEALRTALRWACTLKPADLIRKLQEEIAKIAGKDAA